MGIQDQLKSQSECSTKNKKTRKGKTTYVVDRTQKKKKKIGSLSQDIAELCEDFL